MGNETFQKNASALPTVLVVFGATGDLMRKKLVPALYHLHQKNKLGDRFKIVGYARRLLTTEEFRRQIAAVLRERGIVEAEYPPFLLRFSYIQGTFENGDDYAALASGLREIDDTWGVCTSKLFYCAVPPAFYRVIFEHLSASGLTKPCGSDEGWTRVLVEKPFGTDADTAQKLDELLGRLFKEVQIYRIDHYLAKEMLQNILSFRFSNNLFEHNWSKDSIERIDITLWERIGVEERGALYDGLGALRDVGQNHILQMLALVTMELPEAFTADAVRKERHALLATLVAPDEDHAATGVFRAQYGGYGAIPGVASGSKTETYFKIRTEISSPRWAGVPITLEAGKRMGKNLKEIIVTFKHSEPCLCPQGTHYKNKVYFTLEPEERIIIRFWAKRPGLEREMEERTFDFLLRDAQKKLQYVEEYEKLLSDCITGDQMLYVSTAEVKAMWRFTDPIVRMWQKNIVPLKIYQPDTHAFAAGDMLLNGEDVAAPVKKELGIVGLGKMGKEMAARLSERGWAVHAFDARREVMTDAAEHGIRTYKSMEEFATGLARPRRVWIMVAPAKAVDEVLFAKDGLYAFLERGDAIIDGGNSFFEESVRRAKKFSKRGIHFFDVGVSGGPHGARNGAVLFVGGDSGAYGNVEEIFRELALPDGYGYMGKSGAGHFVKMVHNGIEYGMMQSIAEGFSLLKRSPYRLQLSDVAALYDSGSVIQSRLVGWLKKAYKEYGGDLKAIRGTVGHTGEGEWMVRTAKKMKIPVAVINDALRFRVRSEKHPSYTGKILSALRNQFGGHSTQ
ncbi:MAG: hypothetical protein A2676_03965 [Candidatus Sungbacteria bacterium RIFCSPHIGHO2_01_FULL_51_22]|uniref:Glucose-6-phosphate 1-dehydrogenase n=1 Tax=Candidatus Sungbacteria bacterium RIFCSPHIGHO2_02_FULL_51_29 TaxID=1802273 RepID=A0A1G2KS17_9BACT|nr:MAG: hypothetical protein A2676_03965 [Candidatus Sungbacteria bacterium RIFCSPHIGHO2_01_FULL_51_22]OHA01372.1 MAG: hypothetical protein A3C16_00910 [Candidatus Sungbacteria bacterium RIFCSPHIGHO2_02_FULL_51_29]OHA07927.1 MAG: hypothetical protein A3B29_01280 [Candidatus Sungbacteria bacterium RIFCSPLOWO2_01_FULL_51_34]